MGPMYSFYNQLSVLAYQYGIYMHPIDDLYADESICPQCIGHYTITNHEYQQMAKTLYEKLSSYDTILSEFTAARNIIKHYAQKHDGHQLLYNNSCKMFIGV